MNLHAQYQDAILGSLTFAGGRWKGSLTLPGVGSVPLLLSGARTGPDETSLQLARALPQRYSEMREDIQRHLFEHYEPYKEAVEAGEIDGPARIVAPADVWPHVKVDRVLIERLDGVPTIEVAYRVAWDEEHTLGARISDWRVIELCGSVGPTGGDEPQARGSGLAFRTILFVFAALFGVMMLLIAPGAEKPVFHYAFGTFCLFIAALCFAHGRTQQFIGSAIASVVLVATVWYLIEELTSGPLISGSRSRPSILNAVLALLVFGFPAAAYLRHARFGLRARENLGK